MPLEPLEPRQMLSLVPLGQEGPAEFLLTGRALSGGGNVSLGTMSEGDRVVIDGQFALRDGAPVVRDDAN